MQTLKFQFNVRFDADKNCSISTEHIVNNKAEAYEAGKESNKLVVAFMRGFAEELEDND